MQESLPFNSGESSIHVLVKLTHPIITLIAPRGVTRMAGAKVYAAKLATSPTTTTCENLYLSQSLTRNHSRPPDRILQIRKVIGWGQLAA